MQKDAQILRNVYNIISYITMFYFFGVTSLNFIILNVAVYILLHRVKLYFEFQLLQRCGHFP